jgi:acyl-CoA reductase-like NAD-dependent aldehyde dehydrogenase
MKRLASHDPSNGDLLGEVPVTGTGRIGEIINSARVASKDWRQLKTADRVQILARAYAGLESHIERLAQLLSREMGKDMRRASGEVSGVVHGGPYIAEDVMRALQSKDLGGGSRLEYKPLGVVAVIAPWNYPLAMANNLIVPALVAGNGVVFKPSEETPLIAQEFTEILTQVLPPDLLQIVHGDGEQGQALVEGEVDMIAFTGSQAVGRQIMAHAAGQLKRLVMELGGNDPMIVMEDADIEHAARFAVASSFENAGQMCTSTERIYVDETIAEQFEQRVVELARQYQIGPWNQPGVNIGPIINAKQHGKILEHIRDAEAKGARVLLGGSEQPERYITPTVICDISPDMLLERDETFGPVVAIARYRLIEQAIERANDTDYGLGAVVFGGSRAAEVADRLEAGMIGVNQGVGGAGEAPWVGAKQSGFGFHGSPAGHRQFAQVRVLSE